jgi:hypothetical protein
MVLSVLLFIPPCGYIEQYMKWAFVLANNRMGFLTKLAQNYTSTDPPLIELP